MKLFRFLRHGLRLVLLACAATAHAQTPNDTTRAVALPAAVVTGYGQQLPLGRTAAAVGVLDGRTLAQFSPTALTQAVNTLPGVRLEERATASYRLSIRGSTLRSPFGVRNVKVYYNDLPFTEAGGSTPLNLLDPALIGRVEVLKGPAGSVYGAGTGGVAHFETPAVAAGRVTAWVVSAAGVWAWAVAAQASSASRSPCRRNRNSFMQIRSGRGRPPQYANCWPGAYFFARFGRCYRPRCRFFS